MAFNFRLFLEDGEEAGVFVTGTRHNRATNRAAGTKVAGFRTFTSPSGVSGV